MTTYTYDVSKALTASWKRAFGKAKRSVQKPREMRDPTLGAITNAFVNVAQMTAQVILVCCSLLLGVLQCLFECVAVCCSVCRQHVGG